jgi:hypothetical protein
MIIVCDFMCAITKIAHNFQFFVMISIFFEKLCVILVCDFFSCAIFFVTISIFFNDFNFL